MIKFSFHDIDEAKEIKVAGRLFKHSPEFDTWIEVLDKDCEVTNGQT